MVACQYFELARVEYFEEEARTDVRKGKTDIEMEYEDDWSLVVPTFSISEPEDEEGLPDPEVSKSKTDIEMEYEEDWSLVEPMSQTSE